MQYGVPQVQVPGQVPGLRFFLLPSSDVLSGRCGLEIRRKPWGTVSVPEPLTLDPVGTARVYCENILPLKAREELQGQTPHKIA